MSNGEMLAELQLLLQQEKISAKVAQRMTLSAVTGVLQNTVVIAERIDLVAGQVACLKDTSEQSLVVIGRHTTIIDGWSANPVSRIVMWCGRHIRFTLITLTTIIIVVAVDIIRGGYWSEILSNIDGWLKYLKMVL
jgi:hypothetical protein